MCVTFLYVNDDAVGKSDEYQLIILNNRDENFDRPTSLAAWEGDILAGRDQALPHEKGGTWLGMKNDGKIGILLSMLENNSLTKPDAPTRGRIVNEYLKCSCSAEEYGHQIAQTANLYNGFILLLLDRVNRNDRQLSYRVVYYGNRQNGATPEILESGIYGFGNSFRQTPFKKVAYGIELFTEKIKRLKELSKEDIMEEFIKILKNDKSHHPDEQLLNQTDQPEWVSRAMSQLCYRLPPPFRYGTRSHTIILIDGLGHVSYLERSQVPPPQDFENIVWEDSKFEFDLPR